MIVPRDTTRALCDFVSADGSGTKVAVTRPSTNFTENFCKLEVYFLESEFSLGQWSTHVLRKRYGLDIRGERR